jgi:hypothetical protein
MSDADYYCVSFTTFSLAARPTWRLYTAAIERVSRNGCANGLLSLVHLPRFFVRLIFFFFAAIIPPFAMGLLWCGLGMGWLAAAVSSEDEGEERNENSWQLQFPLSCVRIESLCDSVGCRRKVTQSERKKAAAQHTHNSGRQAGRDREEEEDGGSSEKFRMFWQRRKRFFPQQQSFGCCVAAAAPVTIEYRWSSCFLSYQLVIFSQIHQNPSTLR